MGKCVILPYIRLRRSETPQRAISKKGWLPLFASQLIVKMKDSIKQILPLWELKEDELRPIYSSAWEVGNSYVIKVYSDKVQLERNIKISTILAGCNIPVAEIVPTKTEKNTSNTGTLFFSCQRNCRAGILLILRTEKQPGKWAAPLHDQNI